MCSTMTAALLLVATLWAAPGGGCGPLAGVETLWSDVNGQAAADAETPQQQEVDPDVRGESARRRAWTTAALGLAPWGVLQVLVGGATAVMCGMGCFSMCAFSTGGAGNALGALAALGVFAGMGGLLGLPITFLLLPAAAAVATGVMHFSRAPSSGRALLFWSTLLGPLAVSIPTMVVMGGMLMASTATMGCVGASSTASGGGVLSPLLAVTVGLAGGVLGLGLWLLALAQFGVSGAAHLAALGWLTGGFPSAPARSAPETPAPEDEELGPG